MKNEEWIEDIWITKETKTKEIFKKDDIEKLPEWTEIIAKKYNL